ncbi:MAG: TonB-dependent receptor plug domain-containing protein [Bacteroidota bacterium]
MLAKLTARGFALTLSVLLFSITVFAQKVVTGKVTGPDNQPVVGATISVKGTSVATTTSPAGEFSITVPAGGTALVVSSVGYEEQQFSIGTTTNFSVALHEKVSSLNEIVVTGYATQKKKDLTGAVSVVNVADMNKQPTSAITDQLQGQASGVTIISSGSPGEAPEIRIRGTNTFGNNTPLFVVDGVPTQNIADINPNDITSIQVLKDAGAASIYGSRASNGVMILTTKKGRGKVKVSYDGYYGVQSPKKGNVWDILTPQEMATAKWQALANTFYRTHPSSDVVPYSDGLYGTGASPVLPDYIAPAGAHEGDPSVNPDLYNINPDYTSTDEYAGFYRITKANKTGTDWYHQIFKNAPITSHNVSVSGGSDQGSFLLSFNYFNQEGTLINTYNKRYTVRANSQYNVTKGIRIGENLSYSIQDNPKINILDEGNAVSMAYRQQPIVPVYDIMGNYAGTFSTNGAS